MNAYKQIPNSITSTSSIIYKMLIIVKSELSSAGFKLLNVTVMIFKDNIEKKLDEMQEAFKLSPDKKDFQQLY